MRAHLFVLGLSVLCLCAQAAHPKLIISPTDLGRLKSIQASDPNLRDWFARLRKPSEKMLQDPPIKHTPGQGGLDTARRALHEVTTLAGLYLFDGDARKLARARDEMLRIAAFADWYPQKLLSMAELTAAVALGYDWLHDALSESDRKAIRQALVEKSLKIAIADHHGDSAFYSGNNWGQVGNAGVGLGALALYEEEPELAKQIIENVRRDIRVSTDRYAPSGAWYEGLIYWNYASSYLTLWLAGAKSVLGTDYGLSDTTGLADTGAFLAHMIGPTGRAYDFGDSWGMEENAPQLLWLARRYHRPEIFQRELVRARKGFGGDGWPGILDIVYYDEALASPPAPAPPLDAYFDGITPLLFMRGSWTDPQTAYVAFKAGHPSGSHNHLDVGSFVFDCLGHRWATDLGAERYDVSDYFGAGRWRYYRVRTEGHNTLTISDHRQEPFHSANQVVESSSKITAFRSMPNYSFGIADITPAYDKKLVESVKRGVALRDKSELLVQDEIRGRKELEVIWNFHTGAQISLQGNRAVLSKDGQSVTVEVLEPADGRFEIVSANPRDADPHAEDSPNPGIQNLILRTAVPAGGQRIAVRVFPSATPLPAPALRPLAEWKKP